jgi:hypothetical protein
MHGVDMGIILKWIVMRRVLMVWSEFIWLRIKYRCWAADCTATTSYVKRGKPLEYVYDEQLLYSHHSSCSE